MWLAICTLLIFSFVDLIEQLVDPIFLGHVMGRR
jgi:hypothetical protein